jgi:hypothetical protein
MLIDLHVKETVPDDGFHDYLGSINDELICFVEHRFDLKAHYPDVPIYFGGLVKQRDAYETGIPLRYIKSAKPINFRYEISFKSVPDLETKAPEA